MNGKSSDPSLQPNLLPEDRAASRLTPEEQKEKEAYRQRLRAYLRDPEFRQIEGFPIGEDEDILALSDPPYYTACPNPFMGEIIARWQQERAALRKELGLPDDDQDNGDGMKVYHREPFASDVSEGKNDPIYNAHSYHTKVPHKAVMRYILHYTDPGDIVMDGFCGTGMTGVAAQLCGDKKTVESLGYTVQRDGSVLDEKGELISKLGARKAVLVDLSPAASFIAYNYNTSVDGRAFEREARRILKEVEKECGWMYETWHPHCEDPNRKKARINFTVWSDVFICPQCGNELILWEVAVDSATRRVKKEFNCTFCGSNHTKDSLERARSSVYDPILGKPIQLAKQKPVLINYSFGKEKFEKEPDKEDIRLVKYIDELEIPYWFPTRRIDEDIDLWYERDYRSLGVFAIHNFFTNRNLLMTAYLWQQARQVNDARLRGQIKIWLQSVIMGFTKLNRYLKNAYSQVNRILSGTLYIGSFISEVSPWYSLTGKVNRIRDMSIGVKVNSVAISTCSVSNNIPAEKAIDYIFVDPPFGSNIIYSDLSIIWEAWHRLFTNPDNEAVVHRRKKRGHRLLDYQMMMTKAFERKYFALKPGRWITVEFHNTQNAVWNAIQESILQAGFMIADVSTLDKQVGTFKQVTTTSAVRQDLIISAYKPRSLFERQFLAEKGSIRGAWAFISQHLEQLPIPLVVNGIVETLAERQNYLLYDRMVAFHIMRGLAVPLSAAEFYQGLNQRFLERDSMYFTPEQAAEYDRRRLGAQQVEQLALFVTDERSAIQWLRRELDPATGAGPQTYQDLQPKFLRELHQARYEALPELRAMLEDNFLQDEGGRWYVPNPEKQADLEALRQRSLLREFNEYLKSKGRLKVFRSEAVRAGFSHYWKERDYDTILKVADRLPSNVLEEDQQLLMYVHNAGLRRSQQAKQERLL